MYPESVRISNISARGSLSNVVNLSRLRDKESPSRETAGSIIYQQPMGWRMEIFYGGEFKISQASSKSDLEDAKEFIRDKLSCTIAECELLRVTASGDLTEVPPTIQPSTVEQSLPDNSTWITTIQSGEDNSFAGDVFFRLNGNDVRLFLSQEQYAVSSIRVSEESLVEQVQDIKNKLGQVLD